MEQVVCMKTWRIKKIIQVLHSPNMQMNQAAARTMTMPMKVNQSAHQQTVLKNNALLLINLILTKSLIEIHHSKCLIFGVLYTNIKLFLF